MESIWFKPDLAEEIMRKDDNIFEQTHSIITDIVSGRLDITSLIENMAGVLTNKDAENRERGMKFFTNILKEIPKDYLSELQIKFISKFYIDRLKDNHRVIPPVIEGYLSIVDMKNYNVQYSGEYFTVLFREVPCQSQVRQDRYNIYLTIEKILDMDAQYMKTLGPDFVYGFISAMDGERDPRNLLYLFHFLPKFLAQVPLGHLVEEMFDVISCYYPIDFHPSPGDPAAVSRDELAAALRRCLCARAEFADQCLVLLIEKLDSSLAVAKRDSLKLLTESCKTFKPESYGPFLKTLWSSIQREIAHKTDDELKMAAHEALASLVATLAAATGDDRALEHFLQAILISMQTAVAEATTVARFTDATKTLLTVANASERSCETIAKAMIPAIAAYYEFRTSSKLQIASLEFAGDLYEVATHWRVAGRLQTDDIPRLCLSAVSSPAKEYQIAGFKTLIRVKSALKIDLVLPFVEILMHNIQYSTDEDLLSVSVDAVHAIARTYPELIMSLVVKGNCDLDSLIDRSNLEKRLNLLSNLASIDDFTQTIIEQMLKVIKSEKAPEVIKALNDSISNTSLYPDSKVEQIESDHGLIESVLAWLVKEIEQGRTSPDDGYDLISNTIASLPAEKQTDILTRHTSDILVKCKSDDSYFKVLECLYRSVHRSVYDPHFDSVVKLALNLALESESEVVRVKACCLVAHFLNKAESGQRFDAMYEILKNFLTSCSRDDVEICPRLICLYGWITKALILRGSDLFQFWLNKIVISISNPECSSAGSEAVRCIVSESPASLSPRQHCRLSLLHRQRMFQAFATIAEKVPPPSDKEPYLTTWAYVLEKTPKSVLNNEIGKIVPLAIDALEYDNKDLLIVMVDILTHFVQENNDYVAQSLQTILPRLISLTTYAKSMDVRIKSLQCLYEVANCCATRQLLAHKQDTLLALAPVLDDRKRLVRNAAVRARTRWFLVGAPGENKLN